MKNTIILQMLISIVCIIIALFTPIGYEIEILAGFLFYIVIIQLVCTALLIAIKELSKMSDRDVFQLGIFFQTLVVAFVILMCKGMLQ